MTPIRKGTTPDALDWHYGPTDTASDPGRMWHRSCGGEVFYLEDGYVCSRCLKQSDE